MAIKLYQCTACKKPKIHVKKVQVQYGSVVKDEFICIACLDSADAIIAAVKKMSPKEQEKVSAFVLDKLLSHGKR